MKDITKFTKKEQLQLSAVYIHVTKKERLVAVATNMYVLAQEDLKGTLTSEVANVTGFYSPELYKRLIKAEKKEDLEAIIAIVLEKEAMQYKFKGMTYPDYEQILPSEEKSLLGVSLLESKDFKCNHTLLDQVLTLVAGSQGEVELGNFKVLKFEETKQIYYADETMKLLLMAMSNKK
jgi:hypothetical protein